MKLIVTEKPSVAQSIAAVLGTRQRQDGYLEGGGYLVSWCLGHLVEMAAADAYDPAYSKWQMDDLPILPEPWQYVVTPDKKGAVCRTANSHAAGRCGEHRVCHRRRTRGRADFPPGL